MAYALAVSLKRTLEPLLNSARLRFPILKSELELIYFDLCYLTSFFDKMISLEDSYSVEHLEKQMKVVLHITQDLIESHLIHSGSESSKDESSISGQLVEVKEKLSSLIILFKDKEDFLTAEQQRRGRLTADIAVPSRTDFGRTDKIVGLRDEQMKLQDGLLGENQSLQVISIVGMSGAGKTTLAKEVYLDPSIIKHFRIRLFVKVDLEYKLEELLRDLVGQVVSEETKELAVDEIKDQLFKSLYNRRYLVVLDDIWDTEVWNQLKMYFPDNKNCSAIILTTTIMDVAHGACDRGNILQKRFMNHGESWKLLCNSAFSDMEMQMCPPKLEEIGKTIVERLGGLPLAIVRIGELLSKSPATVENWMAVSQKMYSHLRETAISNVLNPSYAQLPQHLKACFLYLGLFQPNYSIPTSLLFRLWVAERFVDGVEEDKSLEQKAEEYLEYLVSRSLVTVHEVRFTGRIKTCKVHVVLQSACVDEARQQKLFHVVPEVSGTFPRGPKGQRRVGVHSNAVLGFKQVHQSLKSVSAARSLLSVSDQHQLPLPVYLGFKWLSVLHALSVIFRKFPDEVLKLVRLRYLAITYNGELPQSISRLWSLEVLIIHPSQTIDSTVFLPLEIWKLQKLRHLDCMGFDLPDPSTGDGEFLFLIKLLTLSGVSARSCTNGVLARIPNLIKLGIWFQQTDRAVEISSLNGVFTYLHRLQSLKCVFKHRGFQSEDVSFLIGFPSSLTKLTLSGCGFPWKVMKIISQLPNLEVLRLRLHAFRGLVWELDGYEGGFAALKYLLFEDLDIEQWGAEAEHFPVLKQLLFRRCYKLQQIPSEIGYIPTLQVIEVDDCCKSFIDSARRIGWYGIEGLQIRIHSSWDDNEDTAFFDTQAWLDAASEDDFSVNGEEGDDANKGGLHQGSDPLNDLGKPQTRATTRQLKEYLADLFRGDTKDEE